WSVAGSQSERRNPRLGARRGDLGTVSVLARARVQVLAGNVADQIAAGEVVERPASVVKELVENALDAGAHAVRVELEDGGKTLIRVRDDGSGLDREAARVALQRGPTVTVRALFYNTPARRKFLRATATETRAAVEAVTVLALTRPDVAFSLTSDARVLLDCPPAPRLIDRVRALWGVELAD